MATSSAPSTGTALVPSDKPLRRLGDIVENVRAIESYTAGMDLHAFANDRKTYDAVERCLERISEAAGKLGDTASTLVPDQPWAQIRALGNRLRHEYDTIREDRLWEIIQVDLPRLIAACEMALNNSSDGLKS